MSLSKVRVYDLAREVKQDTKRIMEELRREGADVSVPSNSVSKELAEKIRNKYFPKVEAAPKRLIKVIKKQEQPKTDEAPQEFEAPEMIEEAPPFVEEVAAEPVVEVSAEPVAEEEQPKKEASNVKVLKKRPVAETVEEPPVVEEAPPPVVVETPVEPVVEPEPEAAVEVAAEPVVETPVEEAPPVTVPVEEPKIVKPKIFTPGGGTQIKVLQLTQEARDKGIKPGERLVSDAPTKTGKFKPEEKTKEKDRKDFQRTGRKPEFRGTPGESATPLTV